MSNRAICRVGPARFGRRPTVISSDHGLVGLRVEAPLVPPYFPQNDGPDHE